MNHQLFICAVIVIVLVFMLTSRENYHRKDEYMRMGDSCYKVNCINKCARVTEQSADSITTGVGIGTLSGTNCVLRECTPFTREKCASSF